MSSDASAEAEYVSLAEVWKEIERVVPRGQAAGIVGLAPILPSRRPSVSVLSRGADPELSRAGTQAAIL